MTPNSRARKSRWFIFAVFVGLLLASIHWTLQALAPLRPGSSEKIIIEVSRKQTPRGISQSLAEQGIVADGDFFYWVGRITRQWSRLKAGEYEVSPGMSTLEVLHTLASGISVQHPVTVREGENLYEIADDLENKRLAQRLDFLRLCRDPEFLSKLGFDSQIKTLEGYLFPDTYFFNRTMTVEEMIRVMFKRGQALWTEREKNRANALGMSRHEVMTLASMIEKETGAPQERPLISSVFHNRLKKRMRLQSDPTTIYGIWETYQGNLRKADLLEKTAYNTYAIAALPVGPISNPGKEAIEAALFPAESDYLFFVSHNDGTHEFTKTYSDHTLAVRRFQLDPSARQGKSWRDLQQGGASQR